jgi:Tol biopolymer transport system component
MLVLTSCTQSVVTTISEEDEWVVVGAFEHDWFWDIYGINVNEHQVMVSEMAYIGAHPDWSPDGQWIAYSTSYKTTQEKSEIYLVKSDGTRRWKLAKGDKPVWSPTGNKIAYTFHDEIYVFNLDCLSDAKTCNAQTASVLAVGQNPDWSPDGQRMVFERDEAIYVINIDGSEMNKLHVSENGRCTEPDWSPIEDKILLGCWGDNSGFYTIQSDGTDMTRIGDTGGVSPKWSPSGDKIAFIQYLSINSVAGSHTALYVMNADGSNVTRLTFAEGERVFGFSWMPAHRKPKACSLFCE